MAKIAREIANRVSGLPSTSGIQDAQTRSAIDAIYNAFRLRSGDVGSGVDKFLTKEDIQGLIKEDKETIEALAKSVADELFGSDFFQADQRNGEVGKLVDKLLDNFEQSILNSQLFADLSTRISRLDGPANVLGSVANLQNALVREIGNAAIATVQNRDEYLALNSAAVNQINGISARVGRNEGNIVNLQNVTANLDSTIVTTIDNAIARFNNNQSQAGFTQFGKAIATSRTATLNQVDQKFTQFGNNIGQLQVTTNLGTTSIASSVQQTTQVFNQVNNTQGGIEVRLSSNINAVGSLNQQYTVKIDNNGAVSGYGLASNTVNGATESAFVVRADKFAIVNPGTNGRTNAPSGDSVPFGVENGRVFIKEAAIRDAAITRAKIQDAAIDNAKIANLSVNTLKIAGESVFVTRFASSPFSRISLPVGQNVTIAEVFFQIIGLSNNEKAGVSLTAVSARYPIDGTVSNTVLGVAVNGSILGETGATLRGDGQTQATQGIIRVGNGVFRAYVYMRGELNNRSIDQSTFLTVQAGKR